MSRSLRQRRGYAGESARYNWAQGAFGGSRGYAGATASAPHAQGISCPTSQPDAFPDCPERVPPICGANLIAANSMEVTPAGVQIGAQQSLTITAGDACQFRARAIYISAYEFQGATSIANAARLPLILRTVTVGNVSMLRRTDTLGSGPITDPFNAEKQLTPVDWSPFSSINEQSLIMGFQNINNVPVHIFVNIWGDNLS